MSKKIIKLIFVKSDDNFLQFHLTIKKQFIQMKQRVGLEKIIQLI